MHGLPVLFPYVALPAIDVQAFPKAVLATGEIICSAHKKARHDGRAFVAWVSSCDAPNRRFEIYAVIRSLSSSLLKQETALLEQ